MVRFDSLVPCLVCHGRAFEVRDVVAFRRTREGLVPVDVESGGLRCGVRHVCRECCRFLANEINRR